MPYSKTQKKLAGIALAIQRGETPASYSKEATAMARSMTEKQLEDFAGSPVKKKKKYGFVGK